jgi:hypothetical protein
MVIGQISMGNEDDDEYESEEPGIAVYSSSYSIMIFLRRLFRGAFQSNHLL